MQVDSQILEKYYLELIKECEDEGNNHMSGDLSLTTRAIILCALIPNTDGNLAINQLTPKLQTIVNANLEKLMECNRNRNKILHCIFPVSINLSTSTLHAPSTIGLK